MSLRSLLVRDYMLRGGLVLERQQSVLDAARLLTDAGLTGAPVVDGSGFLVGILTEQDCIKAALQAYYHGESGGLVSDRMTPDPMTVSEEDSIIEVAQHFMDHKYYGYPVVAAGGELVGLLRRADVLRALGGFYPR